MKDEDQLLKEAVNEIRSLRNQNQLMSARLEMFDSVMAVLNTEVARRGQGMSPDLAWEIERHLEKKTVVTN